MARQNDHVVPRKGLESNPARGSSPALWGTTGKGTELGLLIFQKRDGAVCAWEGEAILICSCKYTCICMSILCA